jgi:hypothetical protein
MNIATRKYSVQSVDFYRLPLSREDLENFQRQFVELFCESDPSDRVVRRSRRRRNPIPLKWARPQASSARKTPQPIAMRPFLPRCRMTSCDDTTSSGGIRPMQCLRGSHSVSLDGALCRGKRDRHLA